jgi:hypothetical protein
MSNSLKSTADRVREILEVLEDCSFDDGIVALTAASGAYAEHHGHDPTMVAKTMMAIMAMRKKTSDA